MGELKNCENCKHRKIRKSRGYPCMCCELLNPISFNLKWEAEPLKDVHNCFETIDTPIRDYMVNPKEET